MCSDNREGMYIYQSFRLGIVDSGKAEEDGAVAVADG